MKTVGHSRKGVARLKTITRIVCNDMIPGNQVVANIIYHTPGRHFIEKGAVIPPSPEEAAPSLSLGLVAKKQLNSMFGLQDDRWSVSAIMMDCGIFYEDATFQFLQYSDMLETHLTRDVKAGQLEELARDWNSRNSKTGEPFPVKKILQGLKTIGQPRKGAIDRVLGCVDGLQDIESKMKPSSRSVPRFAAQAGLVARPW